MPSNKIVSIDFSSIERRMLYNTIDAALTLPRKHPMRFALLYGIGATKLQDMLTKCIAGLPASVLKTMHLEAAITAFESWQRGAHEKRLLQHRRENAAIAYAAAEVGIASSDTLKRYIHASDATYGTVSGRFTSGTPGFKCVDKTGRIYDLGPVESDMDRDRR